MTGRAIDPLDQTHGLGASSRGNPAHDAWLGDRAMRNQETGDSRTFVIAENGRVIAYYALSTASVARVALPGSLQRNAPDPVSLLLLGQFAVRRGIAPPVATGRRGSYPDRTGRPGCTRSDRWWRATPKQRERER